MHSWLIINLDSSTPWPRALFHVRSPTTIPLPGSLAAPSFLGLKGVSVYVGIVSAPDRRPPSTRVGKTWWRATLVTGNHPPHLACNSLQKEACPPTCGGLIGTAGRKLRHPQCCQHTTFRPSCTFFSLACSPTFTCSRW